MEALSVFLSGLKAWTPTAVSALLIPIILWLISQLQKNERDGVARDAALKKELSEQTTVALKAMTDLLEKHRTEVDRRLDDQSRRISILELESVRKEEFYQATSGWRTEINRLSDIITTQMASTMDKIIALWREKGKNET
jgi:hypothetical protein